MTEEEEKAFKAHIISYLNNEGITSFAEYEKISNSFVMLLRGKRVKVRSGKNIWNSLGAAKNALRCHLESITYKNYALFDKYGKADWNATNETKRKAEDEWIANNIRFVSLQEYLALKQKATKK